METAATRRRQPAVRFELRPGVSYRYYFTEGDSKRTDLPYGDVVPGQSIELDESPVVNNKPVCLVVENEDGQSVFKKCLDDQTQVINWVGDTDDLKKNSNGWGMSIISIAIVLLVVYLIWRWMSNKKEPSSQEMW